MCKEEILAAQLPDLSLVLFFLIAYFLLTEDFWRDTRKEVSRAMSWEQLISKNTI